MKLVRKMLALLAFKMKKYTGNLKNSHKITIDAEEEADVKKR